MATRTRWVIAFALFAAAMSAFPVALAIDQWIVPLRGYSLLIDLSLACMFLVFSAAMVPLPLLARPFVFVGGILLLIVEFFALAIVCFYFTGLEGVQ